MLRTSRALPVILFSVVLCHLAAPAAADPGPNSPPKGPICRLGDGSFVGGEAIVSIDYDTTGRRLVTQSATGVLTVWDAASGKAVRTFDKDADPRNQAYVRTAALADDGNELVTVTTDGIVTRWSVATGKSDGGWSPGQDRITTADFSPDGRRMACFTGKRDLLVCEPATHKVLASLPNRGMESYRMVAISPKGTYAAGWANSGQINVWLVADPNKVFALNGGREFGRDMTFSPDETHLAVGMREAQVDLWDLKTKRSRQVAAGPGSSVMSMTWSPDGSALAVALQQQPMCIINAAGGEATAIFGDEWMTACAVAFEPKGKTLACAMTNGELRLVGRDGKDRGPKITGHRSLVLAAAFLPGGATLVSAGADGRAILWNLPDGKMLGVYRQDKALDSLAVAPDGRVAAAGLTDCAVLDPPSLRELRHVDLTADVEPTTPGTIRSLLFSRNARPERPPTERVAFTDGMVHVLDYTAYLRTMPLSGAKAEATRKEIFSTTETVYWLSPDGRLAVGAVSADRTPLEVRSVPDGVLQLEGLPARTAPTRLAFSPDGELAVGTLPTGSVVLWEFTSGQRALELSLPGSPLSSVALDRTCRRAAVGLATGQTVVWDLTTKAKLATLAGHRRPIVAVAFSPEGDRLACGSADGTLTLWRAPQSAVEANEMTEEQFAALWEQLAQADPAVAMPAMWKLADAVGDIESHVAARLKPDPAPPAEKIRELITALDADAQDDRQAAQDQLLAVGAPAEAALREALKHPHSVEQKTRIEELLKIVGRRLGLTGEPLRTRRAIRLLEWRATPSARRVLTALADGKPATRFATAAKDAADRLAAAAKPESK